MQHHQQTMYAIDPTVYYADPNGAHYMQQMELARIRQVQQQAAIQQQRALLHQQQMMYFEQVEYQQQQQQQQQQQPIHDPTFDPVAIDYTMGMHTYSGQDTPSPPSSSGGKAQKRAEHNAIERARREFLNNKFQQLAHSLPNLEDDPRPSKGTIIERTLEYVKKTVQKEEDLQSEIEQLRLANKNLMSTMTDNITFDDEEDEQEFVLDDTPECEDNFSSRSSVTSTSSQHAYFNNLLQQHQQSYAKYQDSSALLLNKDTFTCF